ncbi:MAG: ATP-binding protein [Lachnospiraceae bacterium]|jgi:DNA phosphorothioation-dependent restriction protein DptH|nr:ATP-binding protein [Lachnospiraceae bacterium]MCI9358872.1 ATP-binding protein [Lachnospiraceae bacterium]
MKDLEGNGINLLQSPNAHILTWGRSGQGKTFFCQKQIEQARKAGQRIFVMDFSGSYTLEQLKRNGIVSLDSLKEFSPYKTPYYFMPFFKTPRAFQESLSNALISQLNIRGYFQKKLLLKSMEEHFKSHSTWNPSEFQATMELMLENLRSKLNTDPEATTREDYENVGKILARFEPFASIHNFHVKMLNTAPIRQIPIQIIQLSEFPEIQREFLTELISEILWTEIYSNPKIHRYDAIVFDEMQFMSLEKGRALANFLREGRKFGVSLILSTQFIANYNREELLTLLQAATKIIFRTTEKELRFTAELIDPQNAKSWERIVNNLERGQAILSGQYTLNSGTKICESPIICKI